MQTCSGRVQLENNLGLHFVSELEILVGEVTSMRLFDRSPRGTPGCSVEARTVVYCPFPSGFGLQPMIEPVSQMSSKKWPGTTLTGIGRLEIKPRATMQRIFKTHAEGHPPKNT